jgi:hypothetical protein
VARRHLHVDFVLFSEFTNNCLADDSFTLRMRQLDLLLSRVLLRILGLGFKDPTLWPFFAGERKSGSLRQGFESLLPGKKHPKWPGISQIWATFGTIFFLFQFFVLFGAFIRSP